MILLPVFLLFLMGGAALLASIRFFQHASQRYKRGIPFARKAGYAFFSLLLSAALWLAGLICFAFQLKGKIGG